MGAGNQEAMPDGHSQADVLRLVGEPNRLEKRVESFIDVPGLRTEDAEAVQDLGENVRITAASREIPSFPEEQGCLVLHITQTGEVIHDPRPHRRSFGEVLRRLPERV